jgi:hypothetical protein
MCGTQSYVSEKKRAVICRREGETLIPEPIPQKITRTRICEQFRPQPAGSTDDGQESKFDREIAARYLGFATERGRARRRRGRSGGGRPGKEGAEERARKKTTEKTGTWEPRIRVLVLTCCSDEEYTCAAYLAYVKPLWEMVTCKGV